MNSIITTYKDTGSFIFKPNDNLQAVCNAPTNKCGVYIFYELTSHDKHLLYIGCSGHIRNDGIAHIRQTGGGGLKGRIVNGHQFDKRKRFNSLPDQMIKEGISQLEIHWYVTCTNEYIHSPIYVESCLLQKYLDTHGRLPRWNRKF